MQTFHLFRTDVSPDQTWRLLEWCHTRGADEFTVSQIYAGVDPKLAFAHFDQVMAPFERPPASRRLLEAYNGEDLEREVHLWALSRDSISQLRSFLVLRST